MTVPIRYNDAPVAALVAFHIHHLEGRAEAVYSFQWWPNGDHESTPEGWGCVIRDEALNALPDMDLEAINFGPFDVGNGYTVRLRNVSGKVTAGITDPGGVTHLIPPFESTLRDHFGDLVRSLP